MTSVLVTVPPSDIKANPYIDIFIDSFVGDVTVERFSYRRAVFGHYNVVHVQWPEYLIRSRGPVKRVVKAIAFTLFIIRIVVGRVPVVRTVHNLDTHEAGGRVEKALLAALDATVDVNVYLNESVENDLDRGVVILHARYPRSAEPVSRVDDRRSILFFGQIRPYKGIENLISAFVGLRSDEKYEDVVLRLVGRPIDTEYAETLQRLIGDDERIVANFGYVSDEDLEVLVQEAACIALPYRHLYNSGSAIYSLGLGTPALLPRSPSTEPLAREVDAGLVHLIDGTIDSADLRQVLDAPSPPPSDDVFGGRRDARAVARLHERLYGELVARRRMGRTVRRKSVLGVLRSDAEFVKHSAMNGSQP